MTVRSPFRPALPGIARLAALGGVLAASIVADAGPAEARARIADGSMCDAAWVDNQGAMDCFIQGEEEIRDGKKHPHYVACTAQGEIFCCVDDDNGNQDCEAQAESRPVRPADHIRAILEGQRTLLMTIERLSNRVRALEERMPEPVEQTEQ